MSEQEPIEGGLGDYGDEDYDLEDDQEEEIDEIEAYNNGYLDQLES